MNDTDIEFFREYISRLTHELLLCQGHGDKDLSHYEPKVELPSWLFSEQILSPLFFAYDMRIEELRSVIEQQGTYLDLITQRMDYLLTENENFRNKQAEYLRATGFDETSNHDRNGVLKEDSLHGYNELLVQQSDLLLEELNNMNSSLSEREKTINGLSSDLEKKVKLIAEYERKSELLEKKLLGTEHELSKEKSSVETMKLQLAELRSNGSQTAATLHSTLIENKEYELEVTEWSKRIMASILSAQDLQEKLLSSSKKIDSLSDKNVRLSEELTRSETKCCILQQSLMTKDLQLENCNKMIENLQKDKISMQLTAKESEIAKEKTDMICRTLQQEIDRLVCDQMDRVKHRNADIKLVMDSLEDDQLELGNDNRISDLNRHIADLEIQVGQLTREKELTNAMNLKLRTTLDREKDAFEATVADISLSLNETTTKLAQEQQQRGCIEGGKKELECKLRIIEEKFGMLSNSLSQEKERRMNDKEEYKRSIKTMEDTMNTVVHNLSKRCKELEADKIILAKRLDDSQMHRCDEIFFLEAKVEQAEKTISDLKNASELQEKYHRSILMESLDKKKIFIDELESKLGDALDKEKRLADEMSTLTQNHTQMVSDKLQHRKVLEDKERKIADLSTQIAVSQQKLAIMSKQLCDSVEEQRERIQREYCLKAEIQRMCINSLSGNKFD